MNEDFATVRTFLGFIDYRKHPDGNPWEALRRIEAELKDEAYIGIERTRAEKAETEVTRLRQELALLRARIPEEQREP